MTKRWIVLPLLILMSTARAEVVYDAMIIKVFTQSRLPGESDAHLIQLDQTISSVCSANRVYIAFEDKELYAAALAYYMAGKPVSLTY